MTDALTRRSSSSSVATYPQAIPRVDPATRTTPLGLRPRGLGVTRGEALRLGYTPTQPYEPPLWARTLTYAPRPLPGTQPAQAESSRPGFPLRVQLPSPFTPGRVDPNLTPESSMDWLNGPVGHALGVTPGEQRGGAMDMFGIPLATTPMTMANFTTWGREGVLALLSSALLGGAYQQSPEATFGQDTEYQGQTENLSLEQQLLKGVIEGGKTVGDAVAAPFVAFGDWQRQENNSYRAQQVANLFAVGHAARPFAGDIGTIDNITTSIFGAFSEHGSEKYSLQELQEHALINGVDLIEMTAEYWDLPTEVVAALYRDPFMAESARDALVNGVPMSRNALVNMGAELGPQVAAIIGAAIATGGVGGILSGLGAGGAATGAGAGATAARLVGGFGQALRGGQMASGLGRAATVGARAGFLTRKAAQLNAVNTTAGWSVRGLEWGIKQVGLIVGDEGIVRNMDRLMYEMPWSMNPGLNIIDGFTTHPRAKLQALREPGRRRIVMGQEGGWSDAGSINLSALGARSMRVYERPVTAQGRLDIEAMVAVRTAIDDIEVEIAGVPETLRASHPMARLVETARTLTMDDIHENLLRGLGWERSWLETAFGEGSQLGLNLDDLRNFVIYGYAQVVRDRGFAPQNLPGVTLRDKGRAFIRSETPELLDSLFDDLRGRSSHLSRSIRGQWWELASLNDSRMAQLKARLADQYEPFVAFENMVHWIGASKAVEKAYRAGAAPGDVVPTYARRLQHNWIGDFRTYIMGRYQAGERVANADVLRLRARAGPVEHYIPRLKQGRRRWTRDELVKAIDRMVEADNRERATANVTRTDPHMPPGWKPGDNPYADARVLGITPEEVMAIEAAMRETPGAGPPVTLLRAVARDAGRDADQLLRDPERAWQEVIGWYEKRLDRMVAISKTRDSLLGMADVLRARAAESADPALADVAVRASNAIDRIVAELVNEPRTRPTGRAVIRDEGVTYADPEGRARWSTAAARANTAASAARTHMESPLSAVRLVEGPGTVYPAMAGKEGVVDALQTLVRYVADNPGRVVLNETDLAIVLDMTKHPLLKADALRRGEWSAAPRETQELAEGLAVDGDQLARELAGSVLGEAFDPEVTPITQALDDVTSQGIAYREEGLRIADELLAAERAFDAVWGRISPETRMLHERIRAEKVDTSRPLVAPENTTLGRQDETFRGRAQRAVEQRAILESRLSDIEEQIAINPQRRGEFDYVPAVDGTGQPFPTFRAITGPKGAATVAAELAAATGLRYEARKIGPRKWQVFQGRPRVQNLEETPTLSEPEIGPNRAQNLEEQQPLTGAEGAIEQAYRAGDIEEGQRLNIEEGVARGGTLESGGAIREEPRIEAEVPEPPRIPRPERLSRADPLIKRLLAATFPEYRGRKFEWREYDRPRTYTAAWDEGAKDDIRIISMEEGVGELAPFNPLRERGGTQQVIDQPPGSILVVHRLRGQYDLGVEFVVRPPEPPPAIAAGPEASPPDLTPDQTAAVQAIRERLEAPERISQEEIDAAVSEIELGTDTSLSTAKLPEAVKEQLREDRVAELPPVPAGWEVDPRSPLVMRQPDPGAPEGFDYRERDVGLVAPDRLGVTHSYFYQVLHQAEKAILTRAVRGPQERRAAGQLVIDAAEYRAAMARKPAGGEVERPMAWHPDIGTFDYGSRRIVAPEYLVTAADRVLAPDFEGRLWPRGTDAAPDWRVHQLVEGTWHAVNLAEGRNVFQRGADEMLADIRAWRDRLGDADVIEGEFVEVPPAPVNGNRTTFIVAGTERAEGTFQLREADSLITSDRTDIFPDELQPRDRARAASLDQISEMARTFDPELALRVETGAEGSPLVGADGIVLAGNGRTMAMRAMTPEKWMQYKLHLAGRAEEFGLTGAQVMAMDRPILVREVGPELMTSEVAGRLNAPTGGMSFAEQARRLALSISADDVAALGEVGETVTVDALLRQRSRRPFIDRVLSTLTDAERRSLVDAAGELNDQAIKLVRAALLTKLIPDIRVATRMIESPQAVRFQTGIEMALAQVLRAEAGARIAGTLPGEGIGPRLAQAMGRIMDLADQGIAQKDWPAEFSTISLDMIAGTTDADALGLVMASLRSQDEVAGLLRGYASAVEDSASAMGGLLVDESRTLPGLVNRGIAALNERRASRAGFGFEAMRTDDIPFLPDPDGTVRATSETTLGDPAAAVVRPVITTPEAAVADSLRSAPSVEVSRLDDLIAVPEGTPVTYRPTHPQDGQRVQRLVELADDAAGLEDELTYLRERVVESAGQRQAVFDGLVDAINRGEGRPADFVLVNAMSSVQRYSDDGRYIPVYDPEAAPILSGLSATLQNEVGAARSIARVAGQADAAEPDAAILMSGGARTVRPEFVEEAGFEPTAGPELERATAARDSGNPVVVPPGDEVVRRAAQQVSGLPRGGDGVIILNEWDEATHLRHLGALRDRLLQERESALAAEEVATQAANALPNPKAELLFPPELLPLWQRYMADDLAVAWDNPGDIRPPRTVKEVYEALRSLDYGFEAAPSMKMTAQEMEQLRDGLRTFLAEKLDEWGVSRDPERGRGARPAGVPATVTEHYEELDALAASLQEKLYVTEDPLEGYLGVGYEFTPPPTQGQSTRLFYETTLTQELAAMDEIVPGLGEEIATGRQQDFPPRVQAANDTYAAEQIANPGIIRQLIDTAVGPRPQRDVDAEAFARFADDWVGVGDEAEKARMLNTPEGFDLMDRRVRVLRGLLRHWHENMRTETFGPLPFHQFRRIGLVNPARIERWTREFLEGQGEEGAAILSEIERRKLAGDHNPMWSAWRKADNRIRAYFAQRDGGVAEWVERMYEGPIKRVSAAASGTTVMYHAMRFLSDVRWLAMEFVEMPVLVVSREGPGALLDAARFQRGQDPKLLFTQGNPLERVMREWAWWSSQSDPGGYYRWRENGLLSVVKRQGERGMVKELERMAREDPRLAALIRANRDTPKSYLTRLDRDWRTMATRGRKLGEDEMKELLAPYVADGVVSADEVNRMAVDGRWVGHPELEAAIAHADDPATRVLLRRLNIIQEQAWGDATALIFGQADRSNLQRLLNHPFLYWPVSYQIKATRWLAGVLTDRAFGYDTGVGGATTLGMVWEGYKDQLANDPEFQQWMKENTTLLFVAQMLMPITPWDIGVSLSPLTRIAHSVALGTDVGGGEPYRRNMYSVGTGYSIMDLWPRLFAEQRKGEGLGADIAERLSHAFPQTIQIDPRD